MKTAITCFALAIIANTSPLTDAYQKDKGLSILSRQEDVTDVPDFTDGPTWNLALTGSNAQSTVDWVWYVTKCLIQPTLYALTCITLTKDAILRP